MSTPPSAPDEVLGLPALDDDAWDDLLNYIEEKRVIPIVGRRRTAPAAPFDS
jgi:hypothetical protein